MAFDINRGSSMADKLYLPPTDPKEEKLSPLSLGSMIISFAAMLYFMLTYTGPVEWAAEFQLNQWGVYSQTITYIVLSIVGWGVLWSIGMLFGKALGIDLDPVQSSKKKENEEPSRLAKFGQRWEALPGVLRFLIHATLLVTALGVFTFVDVANIGELTSVDLRSLEQGTMPPSNYIEVTGRTLPDLSVGWSSNGRESDAVYYMPIVSDAWTPDQGLKVFIVGPAETLHDVSPERPIKGQLSTSSMPRYILNTFERAGITPATEHIYINCQFDPQTYREGNQMFVMVAVGLSTVVAVWFFIRWIRGKPHRQSIATNET